MVIAALGILFVRKAVHAALLLAVVMISLAVLYAALDAPFLFAVQIIVYTGAILMLFLFVLMLVGVDASDSVVETIRGQRVLAMLVGLLLGLVLVVGLGQISLGTAVGLDEANARRQHPGARRHPVLPLRLRLRDHQRPAHHRRRRRDGARPPRATHPEADASRRWPRSGSRTTARAATTSVRCLLRVSTPATTPSTPRRCSRTARPPRLDLPGAGGPRHRAVRTGDSPRTSTRSRGRSAAPRTPVAAQRPRASTEEETPATGGDQE